MNRKGACSYFCTMVKETSKNVEIIGDQVDEPLDKTVGEENRIKNKEGGDNN